MSGRSFGFSAPIRSSKRIPGGNVSTATSFGTARRAGRNDSDNAGNRLTYTISIQNLNSDGTPQVDGNGNPVLTSRTEQYGYDELNRLTSVNYGDGGTQSYSFDNLGNRLQKVDSGSGTENYSYNAANVCPLTIGGVALRATHE